MHVVEKHSFESVPHRVHVATRWGRTSIAVGRNPPLAAAAAAAARTPLTRKSSRDG